MFILTFSTATVFVRSAWAVHFFQIGVFALTVVYLVTGGHGRAGHFSRGWTTWPLYLIPVWGIVQLLTHTTASTFETREALLQWGALVGVFFLSQTAAKTERSERIVLSTFLCFATILGVLCLAQLYTSAGRVLWLFPTGYPSVYGTFPSYNNYAQFVELALPVAIWYALRKDRQSWWYSIAAGLLYGSVIGTGSRAGAGLCTAEVLGILLIGWLTRRDPGTGLHSRFRTSALIMIPILAAACTLIVGWHRVWQRFEMPDKYLVHREYLASALEMAKDRPLTGYGLGTFAEVYPRYAIRDFSFYANHAHNDWVEFVDDGGIGFLLLVLIPFAAAVPTALRRPWGLGVVSVMLHACVDFPFARPAVSGWMFLLLGLLYMTRTRRRANRECAERPIVNQASASSTA